MRSRRLRKDPAQLEIVAFLNLIVVLVPFLLATTVFTRIAVVELTLPDAAAAAAVEQLKAEHLQLEIVVRDGALEVGDRIGGLIQRLPAGPHGLDVAGLEALIAQLKQRFPDERHASILAEPQTDYQTLVQVMDVVRARTTADRGVVTVDERFPDIAVGDAPVRTAAR